MNISVVIPCLNEEGTISICVKKSLEVIRINKSVGEVIVVDNGSTDRSILRAQEAGARVVVENNIGYGNAVRRGISEARGEVIIMGDGDDTYNFSEVQPFIRLIHDGADLVIGNRLTGTFRKNTMPFMHRWFGTPFLTMMVRLLYGSKISDVNCGLRAFKKNAIKDLNLRCDGMEFASEMMIKSALKRLKVVEIPIDFFPAKPGRVSHLNTVKDGWRHLKMILLSRRKIGFFV